MGEGTFLQPGDQYRFTRAGDRDREPGMAGKPISEIALDNAGKLRKAMRDAGSGPAQVARLNLRGVSALNHNERRRARVVPGTLHPRSA